MDICLYFFLKIPKNCNLKTITPVQPKNPPPQPTLHAGTAAIITIPRLSIYLPQPHNKEKDTHPYPFTPTWSLLLGNAEFYSLICAGENECELFDKLSQIKKNSSRNRKTPQIVR